MTEPGWRIKGGENHAPTITYGLLAPFVAANGAEWSLFCPAIGMALDSCARVIELLVRPAAASALGVSLAGPTTESAEGTVVFVAGDCCVVPGSTLIGST